MRSSLVTALLACTENGTRPQARRFLSGLSADELAFIAEFFGSCILEGCCQSAQLYDRVVRFRERHGSDDGDLKTILLVEYLGQVGISAGRPSAA